MDNSLQQIKKPIFLTHQQCETDIFPMVSICCITYNHENYIRDAIEGFLMQKTSFPVEIIIHDDASTDKTARIVKEYADKHPDLIIPILQTENQYSQGNKPLSNIVFPRACGKYIAICEGDDYWTDPYKLQKQVDFLEKKIRYSAVFGQRVVRNEINNIEYLQKFKQKDYFMFDILSGLMPGIQNICVRKDVLKFLPNINSNGDMMLYYACAKWGPLAYIDEPNSVYRITGEGDSSGRPAEKVLEIALKHRFEFNQQLGFPNNRALIKVQVSVILPNLYKNFSITQVRKTIRLLKQYKVNNVLYYPFYFFYSTFYILNALIRKVSQRNIVSQKSL